MVDLYLFGKVFLIFYLWFLIALCILFILNSHKIFKKLKKLEEYCRCKRQETVRNLIPVITDLSKYNKKLQLILGIKKGSLKDFLLAWIPFVFKSFSFYQGTRFGLSLIRRFLR